VIHFKWESTMSALGVSPLRQLATTIRLEDATQRYQAASFRNGARPSGAVVLPKEARIDEQERNEMRADLKRLHEGVDNSFRVALLSGGADWKPMSFTAAEAQVAATREFNLAEVCMVYDVKPGIVSGPTHVAGAGGGAVEQNHEFYKSTIRTQLSLAQDIIQAQLIDLEPDWSEQFFVEFDMAEMLKGDPLAEAQAITAEISAGTMTPNEGRARRNRPPDPSPFADRLYLPFNNLQPLPEPGQQLELLPPAGSPPATVIVDNKVVPGRRTVVRDPSGNIVGIDEAATIAND
jgi:HK97 family phage portal protein